MIASSTRQWCDLSIPGRSRSRVRVACFKTITEAASTLSEGVETLTTSGGDIKDVHLGLHVDGVQMVTDAHQRAVTTLAGQCRYSVDFLVFWCSGVLWLAAGGS